MFQEIRAGINQDFSNLNMLEMTNTNNRVKKIDTCSAGFIILVSGIILGLAVVIIGVCGLTQAISMPEGLDISLIAMGGALIAGSIMQALVF